MHACTLHGGNRQLYDGQPSSWNHSSCSTAMTEIKIFAKATFVNILILTHFGRASYARRDYWKQWTNIFAANVSRCTTVRPLFLALESLIPELSWISRHNARTCKRESHGAHFKTEAKTKSGWAMLVYSDQDDAKMVLPASWVESVSVKGWRPFSSRCNFTPDLCRILPTWNVKRRMNFHDEILDNACPMQCFKHCFLTTFSFILSF